MIDGAIDMRDPVRRNRYYWRRLARLAIIGLVFGVVVGVGGYGLLASALYARHLTHPGCGDTGNIPASVGIGDVQDVTYLSHDGLALRAWYLPPQHGPALHSGVVIPKDVPLGRGLRPNPLRLQEHGSEVAFRNIWVVETK